LNHRRDRVMTVHIQCKVTRFNSKRYSSGERERETDRDRETEGQDSR